MKKISIVVVLVVSVVIFLWIKNDNKNIQVPIKIGVIAPLSGFLASVGEDIRSGIESVSHDGVEFIFEDDACENPKAISAFKKLVELNNIHFIIGPGCGGPQEAIAPLLKNKDIISLVPSAATEDLYERSGGNLYNMQYALEDESAFIAKRMYELGYKRVALIHYANAFSDVHTKTFKKYFKGEIIVDSLIFTDDADVSTELVKIKNAKVDAIFSTDVSFFFAQGMIKVKQFGINVPVFSQYATEIPAARSMVEKVIYSFPKDVTDEKGAVYGLAKQSAEFLIPIVKDCLGDYKCVKAKIDASGEFTNFGIKKRGIILKQIVNGKPMEFK